MKTVDDAFADSARKHEVAAESAAEQVERLRAAGVPSLPDWREGWKDRATSAGARISERLREKTAEYEDFRRHGEMRWREQDLHGAWDAAVNASEVSAYMDGLRFALEALGVKP